MQTKNEELYDILTLLDDMCKSLKKQADAETTNDTLRSNLQYAKSALATASSRLRTAIVLRGEEETDE